MASIPQLCKPANAAILGFLALGTTLVISGQSQSTAARKRTILQDDAEKTQKISKRLQ